jgi:hypothetical protein
MTPDVPRFATVYSVISAWARCSQVDVKSSELRGNKASLLSHDFSLGAQAVRLEELVFRGKLTAAQIIDLHTHVPLFAGLMGPLEALGWRDHLLARPDSRDTVAQGIRRLSSVEAPTLRRCPECVAEDRARYGCAHWRVFHQWPVAQHCVVHSLPLETCCLTCRTPFTRGINPHLADDPCSVCGSTQGMAHPSSPPAAYWSFIRQMHAMLEGRGGLSSHLARAAALSKVAPADLTATRRAAGLRSLVDHVLAQWGAESLDQLALTLGVNWIWFNEAERADHMRRMPPLMSLALMLGGAEHEQTEARWIGRHHASSDYNTKRAA